ncbi:ABC-type transport system, involved in lipoprotein release, permease component [Desulfocapsa sulfexigens DSM 10523]|uniref:ABC-type transport system, involved in lipoprotein release, permease component n=1 Tax=Desulfocapsa sulfexigens (strain DSM 10523 / SB164P1) TaxID=1167006 RepID=M1P931_DESSD|nr:ABC transporter permease [Desulfocapsa sulfexigens]AGF79963.1 ABC-type transport system, involved in lipoprotein release, permease component [Desulfocapsa sulfexigens DSM 10523]
MRLLAHIAFKHLLARRRQSLVSLLGIILGVSFFLTISSLMQGSEKEFIRVLIDNMPHIFITDTYRNPSLQPVEQFYGRSGAIEVRSVKPLTETRGIRGFEQIVDYLRSIPGINASPVLSGQGVLSFAGKNIGIVLDGMIPEDIKDVVTIQDYMISGSLSDLIANPSGIILGKELLRTFSLKRGDNITVTAPTGQIRTFKILGVFNTGRAEYDLNHGFVSLKRMQVLMDRPHRANTIIVKLSDPYRARAIAADLENRIGYKSISWQESSEDLMSTLAIRNIIMYSVVSSVLIVAAFGIYNVISTVVMEKHRDIAILKSMGFLARDIQRIFVIQGFILGITGSLLGLPLGSALMYAIMQIEFKPPGSTEPIVMPLDWGWMQFAIATGFALSAALIAAFLPARKGARVQPVDILRGGI